jgi:hypothetical protein
MYVFGRPGSFRAHERDDLADRPQATVLVMYVLGRLGLFECKFVTAPLSPQERLQGHCALRKGESRRVAAGVAKAARVVPRPFSSCTEPKQAWCAAVRDPNDLRLTGRTPFVVSIRRKAVV